MATNSLPLISWHIDDDESEYICSTTDEYYAERLFFAVESHDVTIVKTFTNEHLRNLCRIPRLFPSEWSAPEQEKQTAYQRACLFGYTDIVQCMLNAGIKVDQEFRCGGHTYIQRSAFMFACHSGSVSTIRALLQALSNDYAEHYKCRNRKNFCSSFFAKQYLIPQNSWIEESSSTANTSESAFPIHFAIAQDNLEMARLIVTSPYGELDADNSWESFRHGGFFPLHIACLFNRSIDMIKLLLIFTGGNNNPLLLTSSAGMYADQMTSDKTVIEYLRPKRLCIIEATERERLKDLEQMLSGIPYQIFIKPLSGQTLTLTVTGHTTTTELTECIQKEWGIPLHQQKLLLEGRPILMWGEEAQPLVHHCIKQDSVLDIVWRNPK
jgi:ankyrin repeat protein